ncbi:hypothetical protein MTO96_043242 [Rhipicephalus appendiculatus]
MMRTSVSGRYDPSASSRFSPGFESSGRWDDNALSQPIGKPDPPKASTLATSLIEASRRQALVVNKETVTSALAYEDVRPASASNVNANVSTVVGPPVLLDSDDESTVGASAAGQFKPTSLGWSAAASQGRT